MVLSLPIFGLKQTLPSPRSSVTNLTAAAGHRRNRTSSSVSVASSRGSVEKVHEKASAATTAEADIIEDNESSTTANALDDRTNAAPRDNESSTTELEGRQQQDADASVPQSDKKKKSSSKNSKNTKKEEVSDDEAAERRELNEALTRLAELFPDIKVEVFRELLTRFDGTSRLQVCTEQLLRYRVEWVKGRWNVPGSNDDVRDKDAVTAHGHRPARRVLQFSESDVVPLEEQFRASNYKKAVRTLVATEFKALSRSTIDAVLAENNFSYTRARPTLRQLSNKTWRATFENFFTIRRKKARGRDFDCEDHPSISWRRVPSKSGGVTMQPVLKETDSAELNAELHDLFLGPMLAALREEQELNDFILAEQLNESQAKDAGALYECECCLSDVTFEQLSTCSAHGHIICFNCIRRTVHEALFGQGWATSVDTPRATLRCLAISTENGCDSHLHVASVKRAITTEKGGQEIYQKFETRLAADSLIKSQLQLIYCPFCSYAEVDPIYHPPPGGIPWTFRRPNLAAIIILSVFLIDLFPTLAAPILLAVLIYPSRVCSIFSTSFRNLCLKYRSQRFKCGNVNCRRTSCITCHKEWRDPHVCHEPLLLSLRATVEAARTAAVKRTCPQCGLSFVKSSGCNKLTCVCGYSMCYLCRKALGARPHPRRRQQQVPLDQLQPPEDVPEEDDLQPEGYKHFCEHFRAVPGSRCTECDKCDLYRTEDEEEVARRAGEEAERAWRIREGVLKPTARFASGENSSESESDSTWATPEMNPHAHPTASTPGWNNMENLRIRLDEALASGKGPDLFRTYGPGNDSDWWSTRLRYWCWDVWYDGRWRGEGRRFMDSFVELVVHLEV